MDTTRTIAKAQIFELDAQGQPKRDNNSPVTVQFNPETLKVAFANQIVPPSNQGGGGGGSGAGDQSANASTQFVGKGTTKLAVQLWFDVNSVIPTELGSETDVRKLTQKVAYFITPKPAPNDSTKQVPPLVRFLWGSFQFDGIIESMEETLEFFSPEGVPLRASVSMNISQQSIQFAFGEANRPNRAPGGGGGAGGAGGSSPAGTTPMTPAPQGASVQSMAAAQGLGDQWQQIAAANNIENPRLVPPGQLLNMNVSATPSVNIGGLPSPFGG